MKSVVAGVLALLAAAVCSAEGWTPPLTVSEAFTENSDSIIVYTTGTSGVYTPGCVANSWIFIANSDPRRARALAMILTALATGKSVRLWYTDSCTTWSYHTTTSVALIN